jgi:hypothetical protein
MYILTILENITSIHQKDETLIFKLFKQLVSVLNLKIVLSYYYN